MRANVEADEILYRAACAVEKQAYVIYHPATLKETDLKTAYTATQIHTAMKKRGFVYTKDYTLRGYKVLIPNEETSLIHAKHTIKLWIERIKEHCDDYTLWLSTEKRTNFRYQRAVTPRIVNGEPRLGYKAGRPDKPLHYKVLREYLIAVHGAKEFKGGEADDALGINRGLMCHIDKDINMVPGEHLHWVENRRYTVPEGVGSLVYMDGKLQGLGLAFFYVQLLIGDSTDNIPGLKNPNCAKGFNFGPKSAYDVLKDCKTEQEMFAKVRELYYTVYNQEWKERLCEIADLVWIMQLPSQRGSDYISEVVTCW